jgi:hypothetical protein
MSLPLDDRIARLDWGGIETQLDDRGYALSREVLTAGERRELVAGFDDDRRYRSVVDMRRHRFGSGVYKYFDAPLPAIVGELREQLYPPLARIANVWAERLRGADRYPDELTEFLDRCRAAGQARPTPLIFRYGEGDYNRLHQDVYGAVRFPFQVLIVLSRPDRDFTGGEFLLVTQPPRAQSIAEAIRPQPGQLLIFPNERRPMTSSRGWYGANVRHGVSPVHSGTRHALGVIFHDAT